MKIKDIFCQYCQITWEMKLYWHIREDAKTLVQLRQSKEQPVQENEARKLAQSLGVYICRLFGIYRLSLIWPSNMELSSLRSFYIDMKNCI